MTTKKLFYLISLLPALSLMSCQTKPDKNTEKKVITTKTSRPKVTTPKVTSTYYGKVSWYAIKCNGGTQTASGIPLRDYAMTAAHKTLPMGTKVRVTNRNNGKSVILTITDRGPYIKGRIIDVTKGAARKLELMRCGVAPCKVEVLKKHKKSSIAKKSNAKNKKSA